MTKTVKYYQTEIMVAQVEIARLQAECLHPSYECVMYSYRVGSYLPTRVCGECAKPVDGITEEESAMVRKEFYGDFPQTTSGASMQITSNDGTLTIPSNVKKENDNV